MAALQSRIDELYKLPLGEFTAARNALAKSLSRDDAGRIKRLAKPTVVPWAVNQVYWRERSAFDRLRKTGERVHAAQIAALKGRAVDIREAAEAHRHALADASRRALDLAASAGSHPDPDELARTLEALSLASELPEPPGRLTRALQPAGFEALAGIAPTGKPARTGTSVHGVRNTFVHGARRTEPRRRARKLSAAGPPNDRAAAEIPRAEASKRRAETEAARREEAERRRDETHRRRAELEMQRAHAAFDRAGAAETRARLVWERTKRELDEAERTLTLARANLAGHDR